MRFRNWGVRRTHPRTDDANRLIGGLRVDRSIGRRPAQWQDHFRPRRDRHAQGRLPALGADAAGGGKTLYAGIGHSERSGRLQGAEQEPRRELDDDERQRKYLLAGPGKDHPARHRRDSSCRPGKASLSSSTTPHRDFIPHRTASAGEQLRAMRATSTPPPTASRGRRLPVRSPRWTGTATLAWVQWARTSTDGTPLAQPRRSKVGSVSSTTHGTWSAGALWRLTSAGTGRRRRHRQRSARTIGPTASFGVFSINAGYRVQGHRDQRRHRQPDVRKDLR